jgi:uncharacterized membrane protein
MAEDNGKGGRSGLRDALPTDALGDEFQRLLSALVGRAVSSASERVGGISDKLENLAGGDGAGAAAAGKAGEKLAEGESPAKAALSATAEGIKSKAGGLKDKVSEMFSGGGSSGKKLKLTNIIEQIDIGAPIYVVYNQWTQFQDFSNFMKKVEGVEQKDDQKLEFKAQVFWSHRTWEATIVDQVPDERIVWKSSGPKGHVDGAVTFHELAPQLTRVLVVLEYHPQGLFERTGNLWRAQGRRARLELKHFRRHVMTQTMLHPDEVQGWRGEIHDGDVVTSDEEGRQQENEPDEAEDSYEGGGEEEQDVSDENEGPEDEYDEPDEDEDEDDEYEAPEDEYDEDEEDNDDEEGLDEDDEYDEANDEEDEYDDDDEQFDDDEAEEDEQPTRRSRRPVGAGRR